MIMNMNKAKMINDAVMSTVDRKAKERGIKEGKLEVALNLLKMGLSVEQVVEGTGLTVEEVEKIRDNLRKWPLCYTSIESLHWFWKYSLKVHKYNELAEVG